MTPTSSSSGRGSAWASEDDMMLFSIIIIALGLGVFGYLAWSSYHGEISAAVITWRQWEIGLLSRFTDAFAYANKQMAAANPYQVTFGALYRISRQIGMAWRLPACILMGLLAIICFVRAAPSRYRRRLDLAGLATELGQSFKAPAAFIDMGLEIVPPKFTGIRPADFALTPEEWVERHALRADGEFEERRALAALTDQLGGVRREPRQGSPAALVVYVAFSLHLIGRRDEAGRLLGAIGEGLADAVAESDGTGPASPLALPPDLLAECKHLLLDTAVFAEADAVVRRHAWTNTGLMSLLNAARKRSGVLAPAQFAWLKLVDRPLWYALQSLGFETEGVGRYLHPNPRVEAVGSRDHWAVERAADIPITEPSFDRAITALQRHARSLARQKSGFVRNRSSQSARAPTN